MARQVVNKILFPLILISATTAIATFRSATANRFASRSNTARRPAPNDPMEFQESGMSSSMAGVGESIHGLIEHKQKFIMSQAEKGMQAGEKLMMMMHDGMNSMGKRGSGHMMNTAKMMNQAQDLFMKGSSDMHGQMKKHLDGTMGRMQGFQGIGKNLLGQAQGITQTLTSGLQGTVSQLQRTGEKVKDQIQGGLHKNTMAMQGIMGSMHGSMSGMGQNMQKNLQGVLTHAQKAAQQVTSHIQQAANDKMNMLQKVMSMPFSMMQKGGGSSGGKY